MEHGAKIGLLAQQQTQRAEIRRAPPETQFYPERAGAGGLSRTFDQGDDARGRDEHVGLSQAPPIQP